MSKGFSAKRLTECLSVREFMAICGCLDSESTLDFKSPGVVKGAVLKPEVRRARFTVHQILRDGDKLEVMVEKQDGTMVTLDVAKLMKGKA